ncbi:MAG TPA: sigma-70 family RNA polymerase sigma factor [Xanthomonadales bacterium]|nr:sigma-70 family RNA polymerase sigma factor [Xanthomonadales bacterium]
MPKSALSQAEFQRAISARSGQWYSVCLRITKSPQLAEDAVQDGLLNAWKNRRQFKKDSKLETWIHSICVNSALSLLRKQHPGRFDSMETEPADPAVSIEESHYHGELSAELGSAMQKLSEDERVCFVLRHLEQWSLKEIAEAVDKNANAVKQSVFRAVNKLRHEMPTLAGEAQ